MLTKSNYLLSVVLFVISLVGTVMSIAGCGGGGNSATQSVSSATQGVDKVSFYLPPKKENYPWAYVEKGLNPELYLGLTNGKGYISSDNYSYYVVQIFDFSDNSKQVDSGAVPPGGNLTFDVPCTPSASKLVITYAQGPAQTNIAWSKQLISLDCTNFSPTTVDEEMVDMNEGFAGGGGVMYDANSSISTVSPLTINSSFEASFAPATGDVDVYRITVSNGLYYQMDTFNLDGNADTILCSLDPSNGSETSCNDDKGDGSLGSTLCFQASSSGSAYFKAKPFGSVRGFYEINASVVSSSTCGDIVDGTVSVTVQPS